MGSSASSMAIPMAEIDYATYQGVRYSNELPNTRDGKRGPIVVTERMEYPAHTQTLFHNFWEGVHIDHGTRPLYGTRAVNADGQFGKYKWMTYNDVVRRSDAIAAGLTVFAGLRRQNFVGMFSKNRVEWGLCGHAIDRQAYVAVPLYDTLGADAVPFIVTHTELTTLVCARDQFDVVMECKATCPTLQYVVQMEPLSDDQRDQAAGLGLQVASLQEIEALGQAKPIPADPPRPEDLATICYTSGTTGTPKGVMLLHRSMVSAGHNAIARLHLRKDEVHLSYLPLAHIFERVVFAAVSKLGAAIGFYQGDVTKLMEDMAELKPTILGSVPRMLNRIYDSISHRIQLADPLHRALFGQAYAAKQAALAQGYKTHALWDSLVFAKFRGVLGGRVRTIVTGSAPLSPEVKTFLKIVFSCDVIEGYGLTETAGGLTLSLPEMPIGPHVGIPNFNVEVRLEDVPEMGYTSDDKPRPRGEVLCKGDTVFAGYFRQPEETAAVVDADGWFHSGDIGCWNADGTLSIIDRKKNIFKLSQGEYIAVEKIEGVYCQSKYVAQIFVYGDSRQSTLVAIVVPDPDVAQTWASSKGLPKEDCRVEKLVANTEFCEEVLEDMTRMARTAKLRGFEMVKTIHLHPIPFSMEEGLITPTFKLKRPQLKTYFQGQISAMYAATPKKLKAKL